MMNIKDWIKRRWFDLRNGHSVYLVFAITFLNFITIQYTLLIEKIDFVNEYLSNIWLFAIIFLLLYVPMAILIGYYHKNEQVPTESKVMTDVNPYTYHVIPNSKEIIQITIQLTTLRTLRKLSEKNITDKKERDEHIKELDDGIKILTQVLEGKSSKDLIRK